MVRIGSFFGSPEIIVLGCSPFEAEVLGILLGLCLGY